MPVAGMCGPMQKCWRSRVSATPSDLESIKACATSTLDSDGSVWLMIGRRRDSRRRHGAKQQDDPKSDGFSNGKEGHKVLWDTFRSIGTRAAYKLHR